MARTQEQIKERAGRRFRSIVSKIDNIAERVAELQAQDAKIEASNLDKALKGVLKSRKLPGLVKRLEDYEQSLPLLEIEAKLGRELPVNGPPTGESVTVEVPTSNVDVKGK